MSSKIDVGSPLLYNIISYPRYNIEEHKKRLKELDDMGIRNAILGGPSKINNTNVLGKGHSGIVIMVTTDAQSKKHMALKIRRTDSPRKNSLMEARFHKLANTIGIGPKLIASKDNFILMDFVDGKGISDWFSDDINERLLNRNNVSRIINNILEKCYNLDRINLDHGELTRIDNHVMISKKSEYIIDFESSSTNRKTSNVTSVAQALFFGGVLAKKINRIIPTKYEDLLENLKIYKKDKCRAKFENIISGINAN